MSIRVCIVDDHALFRKGVRMLLATDEAIEIVGEGASAADALRLLAETSPDVLMLDLTMPGQSGASIIPKIRDEFPSVRILVLTMHDDVEYAQRVLAAGDAAYMSKSAAETEVLSNIHAVLEGRTIVSLRTTLSEPEQLLLGGPTDGNGMPRPQLPPLLLQLSEREREVIGLIALGYTSIEIGDKLFLSSKTIDTYRSRMMSKLKLKSRAELVRFANEHGLGGPAQGSNGTPPGEANPGPA
jgi:two-component system response regulator NreC